MYGLEPVPFENESFIISLAMPGSFSCGGIFLDRELVYQLLPLGTAVLDLL
jgi:hypothetical protein